jgi:hypothetical protein
MHCAHKETAPDGTPRRLQNAVQDDELNGFGDSANHLHFQDISQVNALIAQALECETFLARRAYRLRKFILDLEIYRDHLTELGRRVTA